MASCLRESLGNDLPVSAAISDEPAGTSGSTSSFAAASPACSTAASAGVSPAGSACAGAAERAGFIFHALRSMFTAE